MESGNIIQRIRGAHLKQYFTPPNSPASVSGKEDEEDGCFLPLESTELSSMSPP